jgi:Ca2+-binding RTX toxin-like protein
VTLISSVQESTFDPALVTLSTGADGAPVFTATQGDDVVLGGSGTDTVGGGDSGGGTTTPDSTLTGNDSNEALAGSSGNDLIQGMGGDDTLTGGEGADTLEGGDGADQLILSAGDTGTGGAGSDAFSASGALTDFTSPFTITDMDVTTEALQIQLTGGADLSSLSVTATADGTGSIVSVGGTQIAIVEGVTPLALSLTAGALTVTASS